MFDAAPVTGSGEFAQGSVEQVRGYVAYRPLRCDGRQFPFSGVEGNEQFDELLIDLANGGRAKDGLGAVELIVHLDCPRSKFESFRLG